MTVISLSRSPERTDWIGLWMGDERVPYAGTYKILPSLHTIIATRVRWEETESKREREREATISLDQHGSYLAGRLRGLPLRQRRKG